MKCGRRHTACLAFSGCVVEEVGLLFLPHLLYAPHLTRKACSRFRVYGLGFMAWGVKGRVKGAWCMALLVRTYQPQRLRPCADG